MRNVYLFATLITVCVSNPASKPYIPFVTDPLDQRGILNHEITIPPDRRRSNPRRPSFNFNSDGTDTSDPRNVCPLHFTLGVSRKGHSTRDQRSMAIIEPPTIFPVHPSHGPGRQVIHSTLYEHLDLLTPLQQGFFTSAETSDNSALKTTSTASSAIKEGISEHPDFPLLFESSTFLGAPIIHDVNGDGLPDAVLADYDGGIYFIGLKITNKDNRRYFHRAQVPRLYVRRDWMEQRLNETVNAKTNTAAGLDTQEQQPQHGDDALRYNPNDPYHTYFEYGTHDRDSDVLRGVSADLMNQDHLDIQSLEQRRKRKALQQSHLDGLADTSKDGSGSKASGEVDQHRRRLQEVDSGQEAVAELKEIDHDQSRNVDVADNTDHHDSKDSHHDVAQDSKSDADPNHDPRDAYEVDNHGDDVVGHYYDAGEETGWPDDDAKQHIEERLPNTAQEEDQHEDGEDETGADRYAGYDDYYDHRYRHSYNDYYDEKHYMRLPPHILSSPVLADLKKLYGDGKEREEMIFFAVSYYFDEDEYEGHFAYKRFENVDKGDETESSRGKYIASALVSYNIGDDNPRFGREEHLDLSGDVTSPPDEAIVLNITDLSVKSRMGAFALSPPTVADIDGNGDEDVIIGTSMGIIYCLHARHMYNSDGWPIQLPNPIESRILVEDVLGNTNLEVFVLDAAANVYCIDAKGMVLWRRDLVSTVCPESEVRGLSPMTLGDVDGDGFLDIVLSMKVMSSKGQWVTYVVAISAVTGEDIPHFPTEFDSPLLVDDGSGNSELVQKLPQALLIDLHAFQDHWNQYINRNGTAWNPRIHSKKTRKSSSITPHGGSAPGLHIVQPVGSNLMIIEAGSGCTHSISIGQEIASMVQADDVHGTNNIDLVISTKTGDIVTLESSSIPYHPLNVWNTGEVRGRRNNFAQGFSASQGIFVHEMSRQYRDIFGVYVPITFQIFDNRPNIGNEPDKREYHVEIRDGTSARRAMFRKTYKAAGVYTERLYINFGPGYYTLSVVLRTSHGLIYEDIFHLGYNVHYMDGFALLLWLPLILSALLILFCGKPRLHWDEDGYDEIARGRNQGILGNTTTP